MMIIEIYMNVLITSTYHRFAKWDYDQPESSLEID